MEEALLKQEWFVYVLYGIGLLADSCRQRTEPNGAPSESNAEGPQYRSVNFVEAQFVYLE
jgi:hypothetical protein